jgi:hypothetical protein
MYRLLIRKLKAATLLEPVVAMVIVMLCFAGATTLYVKVLNSDKGRLRLHATILLQQVANDARSTNKYIDEDIESESISVKKRLAKYKGNEKLQLFSLKAFDKNSNLLSEYNELILVK